jgi:hypothetical protein
MITHHLQIWSKALKMERKNHDLTKWEISGNILNPNKMDGEEIQQK